MTNQVQDLNKETYHRALELLNSKDSDDRMIGLNCIDQLNIDRNFLYILLLKRFGNAHHNEWRDCAPIAYYRLKQEGIDVDGILGMPQILSQISRFPDLNFESLELAFEQASIYMQAQLIALNPKSLIDLEVTITVKSKKNDKQTRRVGKSEQGFDAEGSILRNVSDHAQ